MIIHVQLWFSQIYSFWKRFFFFIFLKGSYVKTMPCSEDRLGFLIHTQKKNCIQDHPSQVCGTDASEENILKILFPEGSMLNFLSDGSHLGFKFKFCKDASDNYYCTVWVQSTFWFMRKKYFFIGSYVKTSSFNCGHLGFTTIFFRGPHNKQIHHSIEKILQCQGKIIIFGFFMHI